MGDCILKNILFVSYVQKTGEKTHFSFEGVEHTKYELPCTLRTKLQKD
jgi:hypothetical protein